VRRSCLTASASPSTGPTTSVVELASRGVSVELIDPRTLVPFDFDTVAASVRKTGRLLVVQEAAFPGSRGATLAAWVANNLFDCLECGPGVLGVPEVPVPFAAGLETEWLPGRSRITERVLGMVSGNPSAPALLGSTGDRVPHRRNRRRRRGA
jgi:pyruvate/2-oxoglutarate/acetoin dehydrogenase E1 component